MDQIIIIKCQNNQTLIKNALTRELKILNIDELLISFEENKLSILNTHVLKKYLEDLKELAILKQALEN